MTIALDRVRTFFVHGSNAVAAGLVLALGVAAAATRVTLLPLIAWALAGAAAFFIVEYGTHRFLLHARPAPWPFVRGLQHRLHYDHHSEPERLDLLFLPLWFLLPVLAIYGAGYMLLTRSVAASLALIFGNLCGLLYYEWVHYVAHIPYVPRTPWGRWMKKYHLLHHFKNEHYWFGVTNPSMDFVARTFAGVSDVQKSSTTRDLFGT